MTKELTIGQRIHYYIVYGLCFLLSLLPFWILYGIADFIYFFIRYVFKYRYKVINHNLLNSFPEKSDKERSDIKNGFYHFFCDYIVETIKLFSISKNNLKRRMTFEGIDKIKEEMYALDKNFCFVYLGHYGNWEWIASLPYWVPKDILCGQIYHPLASKAMDKMFLKLRNDFGGKSIAMKETLREIIKLRKDKQKTIIGFISDQSPKPNSIHHWVDFLNQETPVFTGTEKIGKQVDALIYVAHVTRAKRGYYHCAFKPMTTNPKDSDDFTLTDKYMHFLEEIINENPAIWLWSHKRWKHTRQKIEAIQKEIKK